MGTLKTKAVQEQCVCSYQGTEEDKEFFIFFLPQENVIQYYTTKLLPACEKNKKLDLSLFFFCHTADDTNNVISETAKFSHTLRIIIYTCIHIYIYIYNVLATFLCLRFVWSTLQYETNKKKKKCVQQGFICFKLCNKFQYKMQGKKASSEASLNSCTQDEA